MLPNIVLIGFMGSGKTSVGRHLSALTGHRFLDTDQIIREKTKMEITEIFSTLGEEAFRKLETEVLNEIVGSCGIILATGGGIVLREQNRQLLHQIGIVIWLDAQEEVLFQRISHNRKRPLLLTENPRATFHNLFLQRLPIYQKTAHTRIDSTHLTHLETAKKILTAAIKISKNLYNRSSNS
ncbi:MAG: shikimate kinase [Chthoniobacterales bacterium]|nr:shikimate kinase [Chthoniobacterales bacterium]